MRVRLAALLLLIYSLFFGTLVSKVIAAPPKVESITWYSQGTNTTLEIRVNYLGSGNPDAVDKIEVKVDSKLYTINIPPSFPYTPATYVESLDLGQVTGTPTIQARAHSVADGWGDWSSAVTIPEFPVPSLVLFFAVLTLLVMASKRFSHTI